MRLGHLATQPRGVTHRTHGGAHGLDIRTLQRYAKNANPPLEQSRDSPSTSNLKLWVASDMRLGERAQVLQSRLPQPTIRFQHERSKPDAVAR